MKVLYISHDGITDHIGQSQIAPYLLGLATENLSINILSVEKKNNYNLISDYSDLFRKKSIKWDFIYYSKGFLFLPFFIEVIALCFKAIKVAYH